MRDPTAPRELDLSNDLARTITHCLPLNGCDFEIVTGAEITRFSGVSNDIDTEGHSLLCSGSAQGVTVPLDLSAYNKVSVSFWLKDGGNSVANHLALQFTNDTVTINGGLQLNWNLISGKIQVGIGGPPSGSYQLAIYLTPSSGWHHYAWTVDRTIASGSVSSHALYIDGVLQTQQSGGILAAITGNFANSSLYISHPSYLWSGNLKDIIIRGGYLMTANEALSEYQDTTQIYNRTNKRVYLSRVVHILTGSNVVQSASSSTGAVIQYQLLTGNNSAQSSICVSGAVIQFQLLTGSNATQASNSAAGLIIQHQVLTGSYVVQSAVSSAGSLSQRQVLSGGATTQAAVSTSDRVFQQHILSGGLTTQSAISSTGAVVIGDLIKPSKLYFRSEVKLGINFTVEI